MKSPGGPTTASLNDRQRFEIGPQAAAILLAIVAAVPLARWASTWTGPDSHPAMVVFVAELLRGAIPAACWMTMAFGFGWPLRAVLVDRGATDGSSPGRRLPLQLALGVAAALWIDATLGSLGAFATPGIAGLGRGAMIARGLGAIGCTLAVASLLRDPRRAHPRAPGARTTWIIVAAAPALAALAVAATSAPGYLWSSEFGGYDALSYHLELPKAWLAEGRIAPPAHNVYGFLPSFVESAFLQLMAMRGAAVSGDLLPAHRAAVACQWLHALMALGAALVTGACAAAWTRPREHARLAASVATVLVLATPWTIVVGSLAYSEMPVCMFLAAGLTLLAPGDRQSEPSLRSVDVRRAAALGLLAGAACGAKLTAVGFVAVPLAACALMEFPPRRWPALAALGCASAALVLSPWLLRNAVASGNPLFPFATTIFGTGHWDAEQAANFARGHRSDAGLAARLVRFAQQVPLFGFGPNPSPGEPWLPQWSLTPWLGASGLACIAVERARRSTALRLAVVLVVQIIFWLFFTHLQSRFFLPAVVPLSVAAGVGVAAVATRRAAAGTPAVLPRWSVATIASALVALACVPLWSLSREAGGAPAAAIGQSALFTGDVEAEMIRRAAPADMDAIMRAPSAALVVNHLVGNDARVLLVGEARPFWFRSDALPRGDAGAIVWQTTWDRGPLSVAMRRSPDDSRAWTRDLLSEGITHVLIDPAMLERWARSGWNDPLLTATRAMRLAEPPNRVVHRFAGGALLVALDG